MASSRVWKIKTFDRELFTATRLHKREEVNYDYNEDQKMILTLFW